MANVGTHYESIESRSTPVASDRHAASWAASARLLLTLLSVMVVLLDRTVPAVGGENALLLALLASGSFFVVALLARVGLSKQWIRPATLLVCGPFVDLVLSGLLILATNGYLSPFTLWIVFAVVETAFVGTLRHTVAVAAIGAGIHLLVALVPQARPLDLSVLLVRVSYLAGFGVLVGSLGGILARRNRELSGIEDLGRRLEESPDVLSACMVAEGAFGRALRAEAVEVISGNVCYASVAVPKTPPSYIWENTPDARVLMWRVRPCGPDELALGRVMQDRLEVAVRRLRLTQALVEGAAREERLRLADEVHDGYLQTLSAASLRLEVARQLAGEAREAAEEISVVKELMRDGINRARAFLSDQWVEAAPGEERLRAILAGRWRGPWTLEIAPDVELREDQWDVCAMLLREGLNNAMSHGRATTAACLIAKVGGRVRIALECDGQAPPQQVRFGFGLRRLSEVLEAQGAEFSLEKGANEGSRLVATFGVHRA